MRTVYRFAWRYKWPMLIAFLLMLIELSVELTQPLIIAKMIDDGILMNDVSTVYTWGLVLLGLAALAFLSGVTNSFFAAHAAQSFAFDVRKATFEKLQAFTLATFLTFPSSSLITRLTGDVNIVQQVLFMSLRIMFRAPLLVVGSLTMAFFVNVKLAALLLVSAPIIILFVRYMVKRGGKLFGGVQKRLDRVNRTIEENLSATRLVKATGREAYETDRFEQTSGQLRDQTIRAMRTMELTMPVLLFIMNASIMAVLWFGAKDIAASRVQVGEVIAIVNYGMRMTGAFSMFSFLIVLFSRARASAERIEEVLIIDETERTATTKETMMQGDLAFCDVSFRYNEEAPLTLQHVNFSIGRGETLAIMGATGSGKSTLVQLLPRLFEPTSGTITIDGRPIDEWSLPSLRKQIGYVPQRSLLFSGTIAHNLRFGATDATDEELIEAAKIAQIHETILSFPDGYETIVGQKGVNLSGGQKQRLSIARALIRKPRLLILDDSTSALDVATEAKLLHALKPFEATTLLITQKIATAEKADAILLLDEGRVDGFGTSDELLQTSELYRRIVASQQQGGEMDE